MEEGSSIVFLALTNCFHRLNSGWAFLVGFELQKIQQIDFYSPLLILLIVSFRNLVSRSTEIRLLEVFCSTNILFSCSDCQVTAALREAGLESSNLILGIDFTKSNEWSGNLLYKQHAFFYFSLFYYYDIYLRNDTSEWLMIQGKFSFNRKSLHAVGGDPNPYERAISIIGRSLSPFDDDNLIPCFGFGDG